MKIYISGKISGLLIDDVEIMFARYEKEIVARGHEAVNPLKIEHPNNDWLDYMRADIKALMDCDAVFAMPNYKRSMGAMIEVKLARDLKIPVYEDIDMIEVIGFDKDFRYIKGKKKGR